VAVNTAGPTFEVQSRQHQQVLAERLQGVGGGIAGHDCPLVIDAVRPSIDRDPDSIHSIFAIYSIQ
jgi:hypothetical protein